MSYINYKEYSLTSSYKYRKIISVTFSPIKQISNNSYTLIKRHSKGDKIATKFLWLKLSERTCEEDEYYVSIYGYNFKGKLSDVQKWLESFKMFIKDEKLFYKARVFVDNSDYRDSYDITFETNLEADEYVKDLKEKCKNCGNILS